MKRNHTKSCVCSFCKEIKKEIEKKTFRMPYNSYELLRLLVEHRQEKLKERFCSACNFIPIETPRRGVKSGMDKAHRIFSDEWAMLERVKEDLHQAAQATYKNHPNPDMKKFWGIET